jgi:hypothetical protein
VDFDAVYRNLIAPAVEGAGLEPLRAGEDFTEDFNLKPLFEWLTLCPFAVADLTLANASLLLRIGARQAQRPVTTVMLCSDHQETPLGAGALRAIPTRWRLTATPADGLRPSRPWPEARRSPRRSKENSLADRLDYDLVE